ncbi:uncharacterized protein A4U43_C03F24630 [Asparagus officinalis]|uniref:RRM domain-containing protein n=1 Tax=Asparagus officinalis TaxID=4686 RepID=A0A5P1FCN2_ASPOF|nr:uncharacterized protein A4U43_C03F24630 [Asparagus officinalis]
MVSEGASRYVKLMKDQDSSMEEIRPGELNQPVRVPQLEVSKCNECQQPLPESYEPPADEPWTTGIFGCAEDTDSSVHVPTTKAKPVFPKPEKVPLPSTTPARASEVTTSGSNSTSETNDSHKGALSSEVTTSGSNSTSETNDSHKGGHSIFVRNLPLDATVTQLEEVFKKFGPIKPQGVQVRSHKPSNQISVNPNTEKAPIQQMTAARETSSTEDSNQRSSLQRRLQPANSTRTQPEKQLQQNITATEQPSVAA